MKEQIEKLEISDGDILLLRQSGKTKEIELHKLAKTILSYLDKTVFIIILKDDMELTAINKADMNAAGWFKKIT